MIFGMISVARIKRYYWDSCAWLGRINNESAKYHELLLVWRAAEMRQCEIITSTVSQVEVFKKKCEGLDSKPLSDEADREIANLFDQPHVITAHLDWFIAEQARALLRAYPELKKAPDAIHLATALFWNCDAMHTYDSENLIKLTGRIAKRNGEPLEICIPDMTTYGPLFGGKKDLSNGDR